MRDTPYTGPVCRCIRFDPHDEHPCCRNRDAAQPVPPPVTSLAELLARIEAAPAADGYLEAEIRRMLVDRYSGLRPGVATDDTLGLIAGRLPGWNRRVEELLSGRWRARLDRPGMQTVEGVAQGEAATPALALCAAMLRAALTK